MSIETLNLLRSGQIKGVQKLSLNCGLTQFPREIFDLADSLEILDLSNNDLKSLPDDFECLKSLKAAFFINNQFEEVPEVLAQCPQLNIIGFKSNQIQHISETALSPNLRWLILTQNRIEQLPKAMGTLSKLQKLMLAGNQLTFLPEEMAACHNLELIRLSANRLTALPSWLFSLPRLSWLAYASNPLNGARNERGEAKKQTFDAQRSFLRCINWADLSLKHPLGEGASGVISKGLWQETPSHSREVAIKVFKGEITSDGLPIDEMQACIAAGSHPNLVNVLGKVENHPDQKAGLVLSLIPADYQNLGGPASVETGTRAIYLPATVFSFAYTLQIALGIATAIAHLHNQGILHGDLYAHNILVNDAGDSLLGDFGAASFYDPSNSTTASALERLEIRAFGCLLEDLLDRLNPEESEAQPELVHQLRLIQQDCMQPSPALRPLFTVVCDRLTSLHQ